MTQTLRTYTATFTRQQFPWSEPYTTTRDIEARDLQEAIEKSEQVAVSNTHEFMTQNGEKSFVGKMMVENVK